MVVSCREHVLQQRHVTVHALPLLEKPRKLSAHEITEFERIVAGPERISESWSSRPAPKFPLALSQAASASKVSGQTCKFRHRHGRAGRLTGR